MIESFTGDYEFLSNFYFPARVHVLVGGKFVQVQTVEHAYQAYKTVHDEDRMYVINAETPREAKQRGRERGTLANWHDIKVPIMFGLLYEKFQDPELAGLLWNTEKQKLIEGNHWHDNFWGDCHCGRSACEVKGVNMLGKLLMRVRRDLYRAAGEEL